MGMLFDLIVIVAILGCAWWGGAKGFRTASIAALEVTCCLLLAIVLSEPVAGYLHAGIVMAVGDSLSQSWAILVSFAGLAWGSFAVLRTQCHPVDDFDEDETGDVDPLLDRIGGLVAGGVGGAVFAGGVLITLSMVPLLAGFKPNGGHMLVDVGMMMVRAADTFAGDRHEGRSLAVWGEPASRSADLAARLTSEPWNDIDEDGDFGEADRYRDVDGNGTFTPDLYYVDVDQDGTRRIGLADKYQTGSWDGRLNSLDRNRPAAAKPTRNSTQPATRPGSGKPGAAKPSPSGAAKPGPADRPATTPAPPPATGPLPGDDF